VTPIEGTAMQRLLAHLALFCGFCAGPAQAQVVDQVRMQFAHAVYAQSGAEINHDAPQPLLRAVVVLRVRLDAAGRWVPEVLRENPNQPEMTRRALACVQRLEAAFEVPESLRPELQRDGFVEVWLFQTDGRFALKTLALPQRGI
jgi:hypothetical protein